MTLANLSPTETQDLLARMVAQRTALASITANFAQDIPLAEHFDQTLTILANILTASVVRVVLADEENTHYSVGVEAEKLDSVDDDLWAFISQEVIVPDINDAPPNLKLSALDGILKSFIALPLEAKKSQQGVLWVGFDRLYDLTEDQYAFLKIIGHQFATHLAGYLQEGITLAGIPVTDVLAGTSDALMIMDNDGRIRFANSAAKTLFGLDKEHTQTITDVINHKELRQLMAGKFEGNPQDIAITLENERTFQPVVSPIMGQHGLQIGRLLILWEITRFNKIVDNMSMFLHTVSHDLRSPLTAAKGYMDMLGMVGEVNEKQETMIGKVLTSISDMSNLIEKVLDAGRLDPEMGTYQVRREPCDPNDIVDKAFTTLTNVATKKNITLETDIATNIPVLNLDKMMLERAFNNLVENAIKYTQEGGAVTISSKVVDYNLILAVNDNGPGIPQEAQERLFKKGERFHRKGERQVRGSGLGLYIVRNIAQQHNGDVYIQSAEGEGSQFSMIIPIAGANLLGARDED